MGESTPKRKRSQSHAASPSSKKLRSPTKINTTFPRDELLASEEPQNSPRTKVAYHFQGLQLSSPVSKLELTSLPSASPSSPLSPSTEIRKRVRILEADDNVSDSEIPETPQVPSFKINFGPERAVDPFIQKSANGITLHNAVDPVISSAQRNLTPRPRGSGPNKKRNGTPPLQSTSTKILEFTTSNTSFSSTESFLDLELSPSSSLTWLPSEITGHDPTDPDDDGEGINGIGFKPTAAQAYQRMERRRQQMADYKMRETREARAKRGARRRESGSDTAGGEKEMEDMETRRKVRFMVSEGEATNGV